jgi:pimeloyl-ACP methyl ester carboxylesterase
MLNEQSKNSATRPDRGHVHLSDLHGITRLGLSGVDYVVDIVESVHGRVLGIAGASTGTGITGFAYRRVRACSALAGRWLDRSLLPTPPPLQRRSSAERDAMLSILNGLFGDYLQASANALAMDMRLRQDGRALEIDKAALAAALPGATGKVLILVHGLCRTDLQWQRNGHDHGAALARDLGYTPLYLHYNSGLHVSINGRELAALLDRLVGQWPVEVDEIAILGHSMGGLVARSACHYGKKARHKWPGKLRHLVFLGTPHHGAPLERTSNLLVGMLGRSALTAPLARLGQLRSAGITDLRYGNLLDEDWQGLDRFEHADDPRIPVPLPRGVRCYAIAGTTGRRRGDIRDRLLGDGVIPLATALGHHEHPGRVISFARNRTWVAFGIHHLDLLSRAEVYDRIRGWLEGGPEPRRRGARARGRAGD